MTDYMTREEFQDFVMVRILGRETEKKLLDHDAAMRDRLKRIEDAAKNIVKHHAGINLLNVYILRSQYDNLKSALEAK